MGHVYLPKKGGGGGIEIAGQEVVTGEYEEAIA